MLAGIIAGKVGTRFGVPALLLFLITGMLFGSAGLGIQYNDTNKTQFVGMIALTVILFFGGFETKLKEMRTVLGPGIMLSTVGVILTTLCLGGFFYGMDLIGWRPYTSPSPSPFYWQRRCRVPTLPRSSPSCARRTCTSRKACAPS